VTLYKLRAVQSGYSIMKHMLPDELVTYIKSQQAYNVTHNAIVMALLDAGWTQIDIDEAFVLAESPSAKDGEPTSGAVSRPDFMSHAEEIEDEEVALPEGVRIFEEPVVQKRWIEKKEKSASNIVRNPMGLRVMPRRQKMSVGVAGDVSHDKESRVATSTLRSVARGVLNATIILLVLGAIVIISLYFLGYLDVGAS